jgi:hypothetical protein
LLHRASKSSKFSFFHSIFLSFIVDNKKERHDHAWSLDIIRDTNFRHSSKQTEIQADQHDPLEYHRVKAPGCTTTKPPKHYNVQGRTQEQQLASKHMKV